MNFGRLLSATLALTLVACGDGANFGGPTAGTSSDANKKKDIAKVAAKDPAAAAAPRPAAKDPVTGQDVPVKQSGVVSQSFMIKDVLSNEVSFEPAINSLEQDVTLGEQYEAKQLSVAQIDRPLSTNLFKQGAAGMSKSQTFHQTDSGLLDIQVVIDTSGSMKEEQDKLKAKLPALLSQIKDRDWRINVVTTDPGSNPAVLPATTCSRAIISRGDANADAAFLSAIDAGITGSGNERGILMAVEGLKCAKTPWVRANSKIAVLIVSDEDNCSANGGDCPGQAYNNVDYLLNYLSGTLNRPLKTAARVYGIFWNPAVPKTACTTGENPATQYADAVARSGGTFGSICDADFTSTLQKISSDVAEILTADFALQATPDAGSLKMYVNNVLQTSGYTLAGQVVTFSPVPAAGATVRADYNVGATPIMTSFPLGATPVMNTLQVMVQGAMAASNSFNIVGQNLVFTSAPPADATIKVSYRTGGALPKTFTLGQKPKAGSVTAQVNAANVSAFTVNAAGDVTFTNAPDDGASIRFDYTADLGPGLTYPVALTGTQILGLKITDKATKDAVAATFDAGVLTVPADQFIIGRVLALHYHNESAKQFTADLPAEPLPNTLKVTGGNCDAASATVTGKSVAFSCDLADVEKVTVGYDYHVDAARSFTLDQVTDAEAGAWTVELNGTATAEYTRAGNVVILNGIPQGGSIVRLTFTPKAAT